MGAGLALILARQVGAFESDLYSLGQLVVVAGAACAGTGALCSVVISLMRASRDPYRREVAFTRKERTADFAVRRAAYSTLLSEFDSQRRLAPDDVPTLLAEPFSPRTVAQVSSAVRVSLHQALAAEATARALSRLGWGFSVWHDLEVGRKNEHIDHLLVGAQGLMLLMSMGTTVPVSVVLNRVLYDGVPNPDLLTVLGARVNAVLETVALSGVLSVVLVYPDAVLADRRVHLVGGARVPVFVLAASALADALTVGLPGLGECPAWQVERLRASVATHTRFA